ncbi:MAG: hypothetical protein ACI87E_000012 [Mariniblastus sp.]|jgi:hypothetical protein
MKKIFCLLAVAALFATAPLNADVISVNFSEAADRVNQTLTPGTFAGSGLGVDAGNWNNVALLNGSQGSLNDRDGVATGVSVTWGSGGMWGDATANVDADNGIGNAMMLRGYLDDTDDIGGTSDGIGVSIDLSGITYGTYDIIMFGSTDTAGGGYVDATIGGNVYSTTGTKDLYGANPNLDATRTWVASGLSGSSLSITLETRNGATRGSVAGFQIVDTTTAVPEPGTLGMIAMAGIACVLRRRK